MQSANKFKYIISSFDLLIAKASADNLFLSVLMSVFIDHGFMVSII